MHKQRCIMISILLASILCATAPILEERTETKTEVVQSQNSFKMGADVIGTVRADYQTGKYSDFLKEMDKDYRDAKKANELEGLIAIRKEMGKVKIHPEFGKSYRVIQQAKNADLLKAVTEDDSLFAKKVKFAAGSMPDQEERIIALNYKTPGEGQNEDENAVIAIGLEYYYKTIHLDSKQDVADRQEKHIALEMEKTDKMFAASQSFNDKELKTAIANAVGDLDVRLSRMYDMADLIALGKGKIKPSSPTEEKVAAIVSNAQGDLAELHRQLLNNLDNVAKK